MNVRGSAGLVAALLLAACTSSTGTASPVSGSSPRSSSTGAVGLVRVAAASDLRFAMDELVLKWTASNPRIDVQSTYGSSGNFLAQIRQGAPFDVFFSADAEYPRELEEAGLARSGSTQLYGIGQIVTWVPVKSRLDVQARGLQALTDHSVRSIAIANPEHAPYGRAAVAAMKAAGVYDSAQPKLVLGENVSQAAQFVESGNADVGVFALSLALAPGFRDKGRYSVVPLESYPRLEQGAVVLESAADPAAARAFLDFVLGSDGRTVLDRFGFLLPPS